MITTIIILSVLLIISIFININLLKKVERLDDELTDVSLSMDSFIKDIDRAYAAIKKADSRGSFESDDEVGSVFSEIKNIVTKVKDKYNIKEDIDES